MKAGELLEAPQLIKSVSVMDIHRLKTECELALKSPNIITVQKFTGNTSLYRFKKSANEGLYFLSTSRQIGYACQYRTVELSEKTSPVRFGVRQILIHRFPGASAFATGIGASIFWDHLFTEYSCLISDSSQTRDGKNFWEYRIKEALEKGRTVRMIDTSKNEFVDIKTTEELVELSPSIWGEAKWFQRVVIAIFAQ